MEGKIVQGRGGGNFYLHIDTDARFCRIFSVLYQEEEKGKFKSHTGRMVDVSYLHNQRQGISSNNFINPDAILILIILQLDIKSDFGSFQGFVLHHHSVSGLIIGKKVSQNIIEK